MENNLLDNCYTNVLDFIYYYTIPLIFLFVLMLKNKKIYKKIYNLIFYKYIEFFQTKSSIKSNDRCSLKHPKRFYIIEHIFVPIIIKLSFFLQQDDKSLFNKIKLLSIEEFYLLDYISKLTFNYRYFIFDWVDRGFFIGTVCKMEASINIIVFSLSTKEVEILKRLTEKHFIVFNEQENVEIIAPSVQVTGGKPIKSSYYYAFFDEDGKKIDDILKLLLAKSITKTIKYYKKQGIIIGKI